MECGMERRFHRGFTAAEKTELWDRWKRGESLRAVAMATAPLYFPMAKIDNSNFIDGGVVANAPDMCAVHEAVHFLGQKIEDVSVLSIGTTTSKFSLPSSLGRDFGQKLWLKNDRLISTILSSQQQLVDFMLKHQLGRRYVRFDAQPSHEQPRISGLTSRPLVAGKLCSVWQTAVTRRSATIRKSSPCWRTGRRLLNFSTDHRPRFRGVLGRVSWSVHGRLTAWGIPAARITQFDHAVGPCLQPDAMLVDEPSFERDRPDEFSPNSPRI